jgi:predicted membrane protein (TIGR00267 family)
MAKHFKQYFNRLRLVFNRFSTEDSPVFFDDIARRAFVNNAFDGALTLLGILMGNVILGEVHPQTVISTGLSACLAMGVSGSFGRYFSERAESKRTVKQIEDYMFTDLSGSSIERESQRKVLLISLVDGLSPALAAVIPLAPFFLVQAALMVLTTGVIASFILVFLVLFVLGLFLGRISDENMILHGFMVVGVGFIISLIILLSSFIL